MSVVQAFVAVGSNISPAENVREAVRRLALVETIAGISSVYRTPAEGRPEQADYYNCVVKILTSTPPDSLKLETLRRIEQELGRTRSADKYAARTIDLDLIWYDDLVRTSPVLTLPDPEITHRPWLAIGLYELDPNLRMPDSGLPLADVAGRLRRDSMEPLTAYSESLQELISGTR